MSYSFGNYSMKMRQIIFIRIAEDLTKKSNSESVLALLQAAVSEVERDTDVSHNDVDKTVLKMLYCNLILGFSSYSKFLKNYLMVILN